MNIPSLGHAKNDKFCDNFMESVVTSLRKPSNDQYQYQTLSPYYYFYNAEGKNWWAEALKGDSTKLYPVISKFAFKDSTEWGEDVDFYYGDVRNNFSGEKTADLALDGQDYVAGFRGLDIDLYTIGFSLGTENRIDYTEAAKVLENIATGPAYHYDAASGESLTAALKSITGAMSIAATNAYFVDTMGPEFDLSTEKFVNGKEVNATPTIRVLEYTLDANGNRTGEPIVRETITFKGGKVAESDQVFTLDANGNKTFSDIWDDATNVITGRFVRYNANTDKEVKIDLTGDGVGDYTLPAESFFWIIGAIGETEIVLEYQVYLTDSMEGHRNPGVYDTNTSAVLKYTNYLGNNCRKDTVTPAFPWPHAVVGYGFYLVDPDGNPLNQYGDICSFTDSYKLRDPVYIEMLLNGDNKTINAAEVLDAVLNQTYDLYDPATNYEIHIDSSHDQSYWTITVSDGVKESTYVANYGGAPTTQNSKGDPNVAYDRTVVWFALVATPKLKPDTVVIDYGLPVLINVTENDVGLSAGSKVTGIKQHAGTMPSNGSTGADGAITAETVTTQYGAMVKYDDKSVKYTPGNMQMDTEDTFIYEIQDAATKRYYYSTVTVVPATTIYYEDNFVQLSTWNVSDDEAAAQAWMQVGQYADKNQSQSRPGTDPDITTAELDVESIYGYDTAYTNMATYSMGSAMMFRANNAVYGEAQFTFWGTGFDVVSLTSNTTGTITVDVYDADEFAEKNYFAQSKTYMVDTYYGYKYVLCDVTYEYEVDPNTKESKWVKVAATEAANGAVESKVNLPKTANDGDKVSGVEYAWIVDSTASDALYQVPVMKVNGLDYDRYTVVITVYYRPGLDHNKTDESFDFYLDAIRTYDPANDGANSETIKDAYVKDDEGWPEYFELRNLIISKKDFNNLPAGGTNGIIFIDNTEDKDHNTTYTISDYTNFGPNNELYLAPNQAIAFDLNVADTTLAKIHLAMKSVGEEVNVKVYDTDTNKDSVTPITIRTATDLYYDITDLNGKTVVIENVSGAILSITNVKVTYKAEHTDGIESSYFLTTASGARAAVFALMRRSAPAVPEEPVPDTTEPEATKPEPTVPDTTTPSTTAPEETVPESTKPVAKPETTCPQTEKPDAHAPEKPNAPEASEKNENTEQTKPETDLLPLVLTLAGVAALIVAAVVILIAKTSKNGKRVKS